MIEKDEEVQQWLKNIKKKCSSDCYSQLVEVASFITEHTANTAIPHFKSTLSAGCHLAEECLRFNAEGKAIAAALLYPSLKYNKISHETLYAELDSNIVKLSTGVLRTNVIDSLQKINDKAFLNSQSDKLRQMLLSIVGDVRVIFIKLVYCVTILRNIKLADEHTKVTFAEKTMQIYAPLANRLGLGQIKWELEDIALRYLKPQEYFNISKSLKLRRVERENFIDSMKLMLSDLLYKAHIRNSSISGRVKHIYSIHKKITRKETDFSGIFDTSALRILVPSIKDCYEALSIIHSTWNHIPEEFDDYISNPKPNGYQSIHTAVNVPEKGCVEIQIRTTKMHEEAELGVAAHWKYKESDTQSTQYSDKINLLRQMLDWQKTVNQKETHDSANNIFGDRIYVFSPQEQVYDLAHNATALDFAYRVHTQVGHRCKGTKINGKLEPLTHKLKTGDTVEIITGKEDKPSRDWLNPNLGYLNTHHAISKVKTYFRKQNYNENLSQGQTLWEKAARKHEIKKNQLDEIYERFNFKSKDDLLASIGNGDIGISSIINHIRSQQETSINQKSPLPPLQTENKKCNTTSNSQFSIEGVDNLLTQIALCCKPIPGDDILGYITKDRGITIHKSSCTNLQHSHKKSPERVIQVNWQQSSKEHFIVELRIEANDRKGIVHDITHELKHSPVRLVGINSFIDQNKNTAYINLTLNTKETKDLRNMMSSIRKLDGILSVRRL